jgi:hypothetical protein
MLICPKCGAENGKRTKTPVKCCRCWYQFVRSGGENRDNQSGEREREQVRPVQLQRHDKQDSRQRVVDPSPVENDGAVRIDGRGLPQSENGGGKDRIDQPTPIEVDRAIPEVTVASQLAPKPRTRCPRCEGKLFPWGLDMRCENCKQNFPATV